MEAEAALAEARDRLAKMQIAAPFSGVLRAFAVEAGEYLRPGERIAELLDVGALRARVSLTDRQIVSVLPGTEATLDVDARPGEIFRGEVISVGGAADSRSRKFPILLEIDNASGRLLPGMVAQVNLSLGQKRQLMAVPLDAVLEEFGLRYVFVVSGDSQNGWAAQKRRIEARPIAFRPTALEISAGLAEGERIAISSIRQLRDCELECLLHPPLPQVIVPSVGGHDPPPNDDNNDNSNNDADQKYASSLEQVSFMYLMYFIYFIHLTYWIYLMYLMFFT